MTLDKTAFKTGDFGTPKEGLFNIKKNIWVWCEDGNPMKMVAYCPHHKSTPILQCNSVKAVAEAFKPYDNCSLLYFSTVYEPIDTSDFI